MDSWKQGRQYVHMLTDQGTARLAEDLSAGLVPALPGSAGSIARALLGWLPLYLKHSDQRLADIFQPYDNPGSSDGMAPPSAPEEPEELEDERASGPPTPSWRPGRAPGWGWPGCGRCWVTCREGRWTRR